MTSPDTLVEIKQMVKTNLHQAITHSTRASFVASLIVGHHHPGSNPHADPASA